MLTLGEGLSIAAAVLQFGGLVWGAATVSTKLQVIIEQFQEHKESNEKELSQIHLKQDEHSEKIAILGALKGVK